MLKFHIMDCRGRETICKYYFNNKNRSGRIPDIAFKKRLMFEMYINSTLYIFVLVVARKMTNVIINL